MKVELRYRRLPKCGLKVSVALSIETCDDLAKIPWNGVRLRYSPPIDTRNVLAADGKHLRHDLFMNDCITVALHRYGGSPSWMADNYPLGMGDVWPPSSASTIYFASAGAREQMILFLRNLAETLPIDIATEVGVCRLPPLQVDDCRRPRSKRIIRTAPSYSADDVDAEDTHVVVRVAISRTIAPAISPAIAPANAGVNDTFTPAVNGLRVIRR